MPTESSATGKTANEWKNAMTPSYFNMKDINAARDAWGKYWPTILANQELLKMEEEVEERISEKMNTVEIKLQKLNSGSYKKYIWGSELDFYKQVQEISEFNQFGYEIEEINEKENFMVFKNPFEEVPNSGILKLVLQNVDDIFKLGKEKINDFSDSLETFCIEELIFKKEQEMRIL